MLLYVGITADPETRWKQHSYRTDSSEWWPLVSRKTVEWFPIRDAAYEAETRAIQTEGPLYNRAMRPAGLPRAIRRNLSPEIEWTNRHLKPWSDQVAQILQDEIQSGSILPGDLIPTAKQLYRRFNVTEQTCGKVLRALADQGWVHQNRKGGRYYCSEPTSRTSQPAIVSDADKPDYKVFRFAINRPAQAAAAIRAKMTDEQWAAFVAAVTETDANDQAA